MSLGWVDPALPYIKSMAVSALDYPYSSKRVGIDSIRLAIKDFYQSHYPEVFSAKKGAIERAIEEIERVYSRNYFPEMLVNWKQFPDHIGHLYSDGCFRCHNGKHVSDDGKVLSKDCNSCHTILAQRFERDKLRLDLGGIEYRHPIDIGNAWKDMNCSDCHGK